MKPRNLEFFLSTVAGNVFSHAAPHGPRDTIPFHTHIRTGSNLTRSLGDPLPGFLCLPTQFYPDAICLRQAGFLRLTQISKKMLEKARQSRSIGTHLWRMFPDLGRPVP